jgi:tRNA G18 (ribose-2'-O)-methylase SpoU
VKPKTTTLPNLADTSLIHQQAIAAGEDHYGSWQYNVIDEFKSLSGDEIRQRLEDRAFPYAVLLESWLHDFNIGTAIRNANAFGAKEIFYVGNKKFDRRGCAGCYHYTPLKWLPTIDDLLKLKERYVFIGVDNIPGAKPINDYDYEPNTLFIFGSEGVGITPAMQAMCDDMIYIKQYGSIRSLNCGTASGIVLCDYTMKYERKQQCNTQQI